MFNIAEELKKLPDQPGVYIMHDSHDAIIYIGKAVSLRKRVHQYFQPSHDEGIKKAQMVKQIARFEYIITDSELEALVLECNLIKEHCPKYNTMLRDDKTYPYIRVTVGEDFPRVLFSRQQKKDKSRYFGPYTSAGAVKDTIELINKLYQLRTCNRVLPRDTGKERPCLNYHIHQCQAPCQGYISREEYRERIDAAVEFLNGNYAPILKSLEEKMNEASENLEFEKAIEYRELLGSVRQIAQKQKITHTDGEDKDIIALASDDRDAVVQVFFIRDGKLIGRDHFYVRVGTEDTKSQILTTFLFGNAVYSKGDHAAGGDRGSRGLSRVVNRKKRSQGLYPCSAKRYEGKIGRAGAEKCRACTFPGSREDQTRGGKNHRRDERDRASSGDGGTFPRGGI